MEPVKLATACISFNFWGFLSTLHRHVHESIMYLHFATFLASVLLMYYFNLSLAMAPVFPSHVQTEEPSTASPPSIVRQLAVNLDHNRPQEPSPSRESSPPHEPSPPQTPPLSSLGSALGRASSETTRRLQRRPKRSRKARTLNQLQHERDGRKMEPGAATHDRHEPPRTRRQRQGPHHREVNWQELNRIEAESQALHQQQRELQAQLRAIRHEREQEQERTIQQQQEQGQHELHQQHRTESERLQQVLHHAQAAEGWHAALHDMARRDPKRDGELYRLFVREHYATNPDVELVHRVRRGFFVPFPVLRQKTEQWLADGQRLRAHALDLQRASHAHPDEDPEYARRHREHRQLRIEHPWLMRLTATETPFSRFIETGNARPPPSPSTSTLTA